MRHHPVPDESMGPMRKSKFTEEQIAFATMGKAALKAASLSQEERWLAARPGR